MAETQERNRIARRTGFLTVGLIAALVFGIIVLASGDWIPGMVIVVATLVGLARQIRVVVRLCSDGRSPSPPPRHEPRER